MQTGHYRRGEVVVEELSAASGDGVGSQEEWLQTGADTAAAIDADGRLTVLAREVVLKHFL